MANPWTRQAFASWDLPCAYRPFGFNLMNADRYCQLLTDIHDYLVSYEDRHRAPALAEWLLSLSVVASRDALREHIQTTLNAMAGMGSLGDLSIAPMNGHKISDEPDVIGRASEQLWRMTAELYRESMSLLGELRVEGN